jgi:predicted kinase
MNQREPNTLIITRGLPASGKTSWARAWVAAEPGKRVRVNRDDLRAQLFKTPDYSRTQEQAVTVASRAMVKALLIAGFDVVADDMNLRNAYVREWARFVHGTGAELNVIEFPISVEEAIERDAKRTKPVGETAIRRMTKYLVKGHLQELPDDVFDFSADEVDHYEPKPGAPTAVIVDVDGTVALNTSGRSYYGEGLARVSEDTPNEPVVEAIAQERAAGHIIVWLTGRDDEGTCREDTWVWLLEHAGAQEGDPFFQRAPGDKRKDSIIKREIFDCEIRDNYDVRRAYDDRNQVVQMWRSLGLTVLQVADGAF